MKIFGNETKTETEKLIDILLVIGSIILLLLAGFTYGYYRCNKGIYNKYSEYESKLTKQLQAATDKCNELQGQLDQRIVEIKQYKEQLGEIGRTVDDSIRLSEQSRRHIDSIGKTLSNIDATNTDITCILRELRSNQSRIRELVEELQDENNRIREQLRSIPKSTNKQ